MAMSLQEISDHLEIQNLFIDYCDAVDLADIDRFDDIFTPDATIDYSVFGFPRTSYEQTKAFLKEVLPQVPAKQHMIANCRIRLDGDRATARTLCFNPMAEPREGGGHRMVHYHLWYLDKLVRTPQGWRIYERSEEKSHIFTAEGEIS